MNPSVESSVDDEVAAVLSPLETDVENPIQAQQSITSLPDVASSPQTTLNVSPSPTPPLKGKSAKRTEVQAPPGLLLRRSLKQSRDDSDLREMPLLDADVVIRLHSKIVKARALLMDINISLAEIILKHKPVFDEEKRRLITYQASINKLYDEGLTTQFSKLTPIECNLCDNTDFEEWNAAAREINRLT